MVISLGFPTTPVCLLGTGRKRGNAEESGAMVLAEVDLGGGGRRRSLELGGAGLCTPGAGWFRRVRRAEVVRPERERMFGRLDGHPWRKRLPTYRPHALT